MNTPASSSFRTPGRRVLIDRLSRWAVTVGGVGIIASILAILVFIVLEVLPLVRPARVAGTPPIRTAAVSAPLAVISDEYRTHAIVLDRHEGVLALRTADGAVVASRPTGPPIVSGVAAPDGSVLSAVLGDGTLLVVPVAFEIGFAQDGRTVAPRLGESLVLPLGGPGAGAHAVRAGTEGDLTAAAQLAGGRIVLLRRSTTENLLTGEVEAQLERGDLGVEPPLASLLLDGAGSGLYGLTRDGTVVWWDLASSARRQLPRLPAPATAIMLLLGDRSLVVGGRDGSLGVWLPVDEGLVKVRELPGRGAAIDLITRSQRDKGFLAHDAGGGLGLYHSTSQRRLWSGRSPVAGATAIGLTPKGDGALLVGPGEVAALEIANPHPEASLRTYFGKIWYEGYTKPEFVWQSTGGADDFEPKLSLTPLAIGTLKGTVYSLLLAIPLGVLGAMFASQFMHPSLQRVVKPVVEIMAALPSVVLGFLAGLWLAPRLEQVFPSLLLMVVVLPALVLAAGFGWRRLPASLRGRLPAGAEILLYVPVLAGGIWLCLLLEPALERVLFGGSFPRWLAATTGLAYDQRNAVVVGLAMGFAVIPIIFAISEDAFSNVPRTLVSGSLALGASRWQTVTRVVLPTASAGIFSAVMIGFGRAIGETMIVLMATGNTPIMDWSPFNGFRTLSANIAVEIPEAPHGSTLYRTLFLAALLLFVITFVINTVAELVRQRLRRRYASL